jgi:hypothetical protein
MKELKEIPFESGLKFVSFDIANMYTNIPTNELIGIIEGMCERNGLDQTICTDIKKHAR